MPGSTAKSLLHRNVRDIVRGSAAYLAGGIAGSIAPFIVSLIVSRYLGKEALGVFSVCFAVVLAGVLVSDLGLNSLIMREFAGTRVPADLPLPALLRVRFVASSIAALCLATITLFVAPTAHPVVLSLTAFALIVLRSTAGSLENVVKARLHRITSAVLTVGAGIAQIILVYGVLNAGFGIDEVFLAMVAVEAVRMAMLLLVNRPDLTGRAAAYGTELKNLKRLLLAGLPFALIGIFTFVNDRAALFLVAAIRGNAEAGVFSAADRFLIVGVLLDSALYASAFPILSMERGSLRHITRQTLALVLAAAVVLTIVLLFAAPLIIGVTFRFSESVPLLMILSLSLPAMALGSVVRIALFAMHRERTVAMVFGLVCLATIAADLAVVPFAGATGAAVVAVVIEYCLLAIYGFMYNRGVAPGAHGAHT